MYSRRTRPRVQLPVTIDAQSSRSPEQRIEEYGEEALLILIENGFTLTEAARAVGVTRRAFMNWMDSSAERRLQFDRAMEASAEAIDLKAVALLESLHPRSTRADMLRVKELVSHYRWQAQTRDPKRYGDKKQLTITTPASNMSDEELQEQLQRLLGNAAPGPIIDMTAEKIH